MSFGILMNWGENHHLLQKITKQKFELAHRTDTIFSQVKWFMSTKRFY